MIDQKSQQNTQGNQGNMGGQSNWQFQSPVDNKTYNLLSTLVSKLEAIEVYQKYMKDGDEHSRQMFMQFAQRDAADVQHLLDMLKQSFRQ